MSVSTGACNYCARNRAAVVFAPTAAGRRGACVDSVCRAQLEAVRLRGIPTPTRLREPGGEPETVIRSGERTRRLLEEDRSGRSRPE